MSEVYGAGHGDGQLPDAAQERRAANGPLREVRNGKIVSWPDPGTH